MTETKYIFGPSGHVAKIKGGTKYYYHSDHLGSLRQETDSNGNTVWASPAVYEPFGELRSGGPANNEEGHLYTGKLRDTSTGLYYYGARYYDAKVGRFITKDLWAGDISMPQTLNDYIYVLNNPLKLIDLIGNTPYCPLCKPGEGYIAPPLPVSHYLFGLLLAAIITGGIVAWAYGLFALAWRGLQLLGSWVVTQLKTAWADITAWAIRFKDSAITWIRFQANTRSAQINDYLNRAILLIRGLIEKNYNKFIDWVKRAPNEALRLMTEFVYEHRTEIPQWTAHLVEFVWEKISGREDYRIVGAWIPEWIKAPGGWAATGRWIYIENLPLE